MSQYSIPLWGEIPHVTDTDSGIAALEREQITKPKHMDVEGPLLHQPSSRHRPPTNEVLPGEYFKMDPVVVHTIRILNHIKRLKAAIEVLQSDVKQESDMAVTTVGPIPEYDGPEIKDRSRQRHFSEEEYQSDFVRGLPNPPPPIDEIACRKLLRRSTCAILAHLNFDTARESVIDTMTDLCHQFLIQFTRHMGAAADKRAQQGADGFPDVLERTFYELGLGSMTELHTFYQKRVLDYHKRLLTQCQDLMQVYTTLNLQHQQQQQQKMALGSGVDPSGSDTLHVIRIKEEPSNSDIQFPLLDENSEVTEAEQLLNIESLATFEITVEHETATGLTTEVETKWSGNKGGDSRTRQQTAAGASAASAGAAATSASTPSEEVSSGDISGAPASVSSVRTPQSAAPQSVAGRDEDSAIQEPGSISSMDIFSPGVPTPSAPKKKKKS